MVFLLYSDFSFLIQGSRELPLEDTLMQNSTLFRRAAALLLTAALALTLVLPGLAAYEMPIQTVNEASRSICSTRTSTSPFWNRTRTSSATLPA